MKLETLAIHAGRRPDSATGAVAPSIHLSTTYERAEDGSYPQGYIYSRVGNPNREALEARIAALEGGVDAAAFPSGSAASMATFQSLPPGSHVLLLADVFYGTRLVLKRLLAERGVASSFVESADPEQIAAALRPETKLVWLETPSNPLLSLTDIAAVVAAVRGRGVLVACDNTWATPALQRPFEFGADLVVHSTTKHFGGHSDALGGIVVARESSPMFDRIRELQRIGGWVPSPFDCWLIARGAMTLPVRVRAQSENAGIVAAFLAEHSAVERVYYPGRTDHPGHDIARRQMDGFGAMLSFQVRGGREDAMRAASRVRIIVRATSLGGVESYIEHRASIEGTGTRAPENLLRLSVGLEHPDDLIADLDEALRPG